MSNLIGLCALLGLAVLLAQAQTVENMTLDEFSRSISERGNSRTLVLFTDYECHETPNARCDEMREYFVAASNKLYQEAPVMQPAEGLTECAEKEDGSIPVEDDDGKADSVKFINVHDHFGKIMEYTKLETIPRIVFYENGKPVEVKAYHSARARSDAEALLQFVRRVVAPVVYQPGSEQDLLEFLYPETESVRSYVDEDPVTFILLEPEMGSVRSRVRFEDVARKHRARGFFARVRIGDGGDWTRRLNLTSAVVTPPSLIRVEYGRPTRVILNGLSETTKEGAMEAAVERYRFPSIADVGVNNAIPLLESRHGFIVALGLYADAKEKDIVSHQLERAFQNYEEDFIFATLNRTRYPEYLRIYLEQGDERFLVLDKSRGVFFLGNPNRDVIAFLGGILSDEEFKFHERGSQALPRLIRKAFQYRPFMFILCLIGFTTIVSVVICCSCGLRSAITGMDRPTFRRPRLLPTDLSEEEADEFKGPVPSDAAEVSEIPNDTVKSGEALVSADTKPAEPSHSSGDD